MSIYDFSFCRLEKPDEIAGARGGYIGKAARQIILVPIDVTV